MLAGFEGLGWSVKLQEKRNNYFISLVKELVVGNGLNKGDLLKYFLVDVEGRKAVLLFFDKQGLDSTEEVSITVNKFFFRPVS